MCGRFSFVADAEKVKKVLPKVKFTEGVKTSYNIAPTQQAYVVTTNQQDMLTTMSWGLVPSWAMEGKPNAALINARIETILEKPSFKQPFLHQRCLIPVDSFYEWRNISGRKVPYRILKTDEELLVLAGIHSVWKNMLTTFSIITTAPNAEMAHIHTRMPAVLKTENECMAWLSPQTAVEDLLELCQTPPDGLLKMYRVSEKINSVKYNSTDLHQAVPEDLTLF